MSQADNAMLSFQCFLNANPSICHRQVFNVKLHFPEHLVVEDQRIELRVISVSTARKHYIEYKVDCFEPFHMMRRLYFIRITQPIPLDLRCILQRSCNYYTCTCT
jgi:hypothetical protein